MQSPSKARRRRDPSQFHLRVTIDQDAYALLKGECRLDAQGRCMGMARVVNRCVYLTLGHKRGERKTS